jgi:hypothetical protein
LSKKEASKVPRAIIAAMNKAERVKNAIYPIKTRSPLKKLLA